MMKLQDVILKAMAKRITWMAAAEIAGVSDRTMRRIKQRYEEVGYDGLFDQRRGKRSIHRIALETGERVLALYQEKYFDFSVRHFHEKLGKEHQIQVSYSWVKQALQGAGLVKRRSKRGWHRRRRPRRPLPGMLLHIDGSKHRWFQDDRYDDLIVILDDATSEIYSAQLGEEESTMTVLAGLREVIESQGVFCALYSDRGSHFFYTPAAGGKVDKSRPTQVGSDARTGDSNHCGLLAGGTGAVGTQLRDVAESTAAGAARGGPREAGGSQSVSAGALHRRIQPPLLSARAGERDRVSRL